MHGRVQLFQFHGRVPGHRRVADIRVDFAFRSDANAHWLKFLGQMHFVRRNYHATRRDLVAYRFDREVFPVSDKFHFRSHVAR